jgi:hypothetical protein
MIREFEQKWEQDYVRKTTETHQVQVDRRRIVYEKNVQRTDIDSSWNRTTKRTHTHTLPTHSLTHPYIYTFLCVSHTPIH